MKGTVRLLLVLHGAVVLVSALAGAFLWAPAGWRSTLAGALSFSLPVVVFSLLVLRASAAETGRFWGRFLWAEGLKWVGAAVLLGAAFLAKVFEPQPLLAGFLCSVVVQVLFPIFVPKASDS